MGIDWYQGTELEVEAPCLQEAEVTDSTSCVRNKASEGIAVN